MEEVEKIQNFNILIFISALMIIITSIFPKKNDANQLFQSIYDKY